MVLGIINTAITTDGRHAHRFFTDNVVFRSVLVFTEGWKEVGYNTVIYLWYPQDRYNAVKGGRVDGASKWRQIWNITMPGLPTIVLMLILQGGLYFETGI